jgi:hypothetical protein
VIGLTASTVSKDYVAYAIILFFGAEAKDVPMLSIALQILAAWVAVAVIFGLMVGASIRSAEKLRKEEMLNSLFSYLAEKQSAG